MARDRAPLISASTTFSVSRAPASAVSASGCFPTTWWRRAGGLVQLFGEAETIALDAYFVYPEELKTVARVQVFRDFLVAKAQRWNF